VCHIYLFETKRAWSDESLVFGRLSGEVLGNICDFIDHSFPRLSASFSCFDYGEHFGLAHLLNLSNRNSPLPCLLLSLLLNHIRQDFACSLIFSVHKESGNWFGILGVFLGLDFLLLMGLNFLVHFDFLLVSLFVKYLSFNSSKFLGLF
jgi:hypothetical protein